MELVTFKLFWLLLVVVGCFGVVLVEEFVAKVFTGGKVTVPKRLRELFKVVDGDYVRLALVEVLEKESGYRVRRRIT